MCRSGRWCLDGPGMLAAAGNEREQAQDPTAHAEILALRAAARALGAWRLTGCTLVVTLEPCTMCAGALVLARVQRLVFGAYDPKAGAVASLFDVVRDSRLNHRVDVRGGILEDRVRRLADRFLCLAVIRSGPCSESLHRRRDRGRQCTTARQIAHFCETAQIFDIASTMASRWLSEFVQRALTPSTLLQSGIMSLLALVVVTTSGRELEPRHWFWLWIAGFVVAILGAALIRLPMLLRERRDEGCSQDS